MNDFHACPLHRQNPKYAPRPDYWLADQWSAEAWRIGLPPRICSHCGSCHPEDVLRLIHTGWEIELTDKIDAWLLQPPGHHAYMESYFKALQEAFVRHRQFETPVPEFWHPTPAVKANLAHLSLDQVMEIQRTMGGASGCTPENSPVGCVA